MHKDSLNLFTVSPDPPETRRPSRPHQTPPAALLQTAFGITVSPSADEPTSRAHIHPQRYRRGTETAPRGKKHLTVTHISLSDDAKRAAGRFGKAHPPNTSTSHTLGAFPFFYDPQTSPHPPQTGSGHTPYRNDTLRTSVQIAEDRLRRLAVAHPSHRAAAESALREMAGDVAIVRTEAHLSRRVAAAAYARESAGRCAQIRAEDAKRVDQLGPPNAHLTASTPFATAQTAPHADTPRQTRRPNKAAPNHFPIWGMGDGKEGEEEERERPTRHVHAGRFVDHIDLTQSAYADPPPVGVRAATRHTHISNTAQRESSACWDEEEMRRAKARCGWSARHKEREDFIFGPDKPLEAPKQTLRGETEARWRAEETRAAERRTGRGMSWQSHKKTALW